MNTPPMSTTLKISDEAKALVAKFRSTVIGLSDVSSRTLALLAQEAITAATTTQQAECERLTKERDDIRGQAERLRAVLDKRIFDWLNERACCDGHECGCMGVSRLDQIVGEEVGTQLTHLRATCEALRKELAEAKAANTRLERDKARYDFCKRQMFVSTHGIAPGVTALFMPPLPVDGVMGYADEIVDRAMMPGTAANVAALTDAAQSSPEAQGKAGT